MSGGAVARWFPHSVAASRRHLSPLRRERKGASAGYCSPLVGEMSGRTEGGAKELDLSKKPADPVTP
ncbi:hypothetical protein MesoLj113a_05840 [Mesorhizobium sp. 113-1-2]|nr:hypothetical protein MesoLj113a_05840 [Mesorhizobium sp. 113-1-2]